ncbi:uncharacterized protein LOC119272233 [Triticum dicoccoides]|uniref:uncharacterized protein LOC119272233 n=1 Tax=Triticum dicoccoides TaxID=85692 RepID=UPI00188EF239|nr:uncharacterized protein LOC119272233 [Triticum dicoccoides]
MSVDPDRTYIVVGEQRRLGLHGAVGKHGKPRKLYSFLTLLFDQLLCVRLTDGACLILDCIYCLVLGALDGGLDIPHSDKRFGGFKKDEKQLDTKIHLKFIYEDHVVDCMKLMRSLINANFTLVGTSRRGLRLMTWKHCTRRFMLPFVLILPWQNQPRNLQRRTRVNGTVRCTYNLKKR